MLLDRLGLTAVHQRSTDGTLLQIPWRTPAHGLLLRASKHPVVVVMLPVCGVEDARFGAWLGGRGIYRVENPTGTVARIGEGRVIDRVRRHRAAPVVLPALLVAAFGSDREWSYVERRYLEEAWSNRWVAAGNVLASRTFTRRPLIDDGGVVRRLQAVLDCIDDLALTGMRVLDNDADDFSPVADGEVEAWPVPSSERHSISIVRAEADAPARIHPVRSSVHSQRFPDGTQLRFEDGCISASATALSKDVVLHAGSTVYLTVSPSVGRIFAAQHQAFLLAAKVEPKGEIGVTRAPIISASAAYLLKHVTAGRAHTVSRWRTS
jgi:hypothetical protein